jgi:bifunctional ADP-heptose synthase (sugar kinase/adenylyltransferase)
VLTDAVIETILARLPSLDIGVLGDLFLDRYLDLDDTLTEPSVETGLDAYQVVRVRSYPGAAGTVINNLVALGVGRVCPIAIIGDDGEGYELRQALARMPAVDPAGIISVADRRTPTYTKPMLSEAGKTARELHRIDIKNRVPLSGAAENMVLAALEKSLQAIDGLVVVDQVSETDCGVVTGSVRERLERPGTAFPGTLILIDSRERIGLFRGNLLKPNQRECLRAAGGSSTDLEAAAITLANRTAGVVYCTAGERGILLAGAAKTLQGERVYDWIPSFPVRAPVDPVGAGDSTSAGIISALTAGASPWQAAAFGNLVASITVQQIGTTGTATPEQVRQRWREVAQVAERESE